jgi:hypothetical protein
MTWDVALADGPVSTSGGNGSGQPDLSSAGNGDRFPGLDLQIPFVLASADNLETEFTNYVRGYRGALDYIW